jgi:hypothetical protein
MALEHITAVAGLYRHPRSSGTVRKTEYLEDLADSRGIARRRKEAELFAETTRFDTAFGFHSNGVKTIRGGDYEIITSPRHPSTAMVRYTLAGAVPHRVVFIKRADGVEYYNPNGTPYDALPSNLKAVLYRELDMGKHITPLTTITPTTSLLINHQGRFPVCADCSIVRSVMSHESNQTFHEGMATQPPVGGKTHVEKVMGVKHETLEKGTTESAELPASAKMKKGGIVKGKKGEAVPIVAHAGELVVPVEAVPSVLKSSAWIEHVMKVKKEHNVSYKEAMKMAKGSYKTNK